MTIRRLMNAIRRLRRYRRHVIRCRRRGREARMMAPGMLRKKMKRKISLL
jgi:hypothetical protein